LCLCCLKSRSHIAHCTAHGKWRLQVCDVTTTDGGMNTHHQKKVQPPTEQAQLCAHQQHVHCCPWPCRRANDVDAVCERITAGSSQQIDVCRLILQQCSCRLPEGASNQPHHNLHAHQQQQQQQHLQQCPTCGREVAVRYSVNMSSCGASGHAAALASPLKRFGACLGALLAWVRSHGVRSAGLAAGWAPCYSM
jgi:hypothetical protein